MIDITLAFRTLLLESADLTALVDQRVFSDFLPQSQPSPAVVFGVQTATAFEGLEGPIGMDQDAMLIDSYGNTRAEANAVAHEVWKQATTTANLPGTWSGVYIMGITRRTGTRHTIDRAEAGSDQRRFLSTQTLLITYNSLVEVI